MNKFTLEQAEQVADSVTHVDCPYGSPLGAVINVTIRVTPENHSAIVAFCGGHLNNEVKPMKKLIKYIRDEDEKCSTDTKLICPHCGVEVSDDMRECPNCHIPLEDPDDTTIIK